ncbi:IclR family transcriptional regulator [Pseudomonas sp. Marseille-QA0892]
MENGRRQKVQAAEVGTDILKALAELAPATTLSRLAAHLNMAPAKVHRYLQSLIASGFAEQDAVSNHYALGPAALFVGLSALRTLDVAKIAGPELVQLRDALNETCFLAVWGNRGPTVVQVEQAARAVTLVTQVGSVLPLLGSSTGMVFHAFLPEAETSALSVVERAAVGAPSRDTVERSAAHVRNTHLSAVHGLLMPGVNAVSAPVFSASGRIAGVMTILGTAPGFRADEDTTVTAALRHAARRVSTRMGGAEWAMTPPGDDLPYTNL